MTGIKIIDDILSDLLAIPKRFIRQYKKNGKWNYTKIAIDLIPFLVISYMFNKYLQGVFASDKADILDKCVEGFSLMFQVYPYSAPYPKGVPLIGGVLAGVCFKLWLNARKKNAKKFRHGEEYGSARWGTEKDFEPYTDDNRWFNIPLTASEWLRMTRPSHPKYDRNKNILIVGGSGAGKTRGFVKPSIMQMHSSYVVTDPKGLVSYVQRLSVLGKCLKTLKITDISLFIIIYQGGNAHAVRSTL